MVHVGNTESPRQPGRNVPRQRQPAHTLKGPASPSPSSSGSGHVQEVVLRVAVEGAAEAHSVFYPSLVHLQVQPRSFAVVEHPHTHVGPHAQEHGREPPDFKGVWAQNRSGDVGGSDGITPSTTTTCMAHADPHTQPSLHTQ